MEGTADKKYIYTFHVGMTCEGCSNAINKLMGTESSYVDSFEISLPDKTLKVIGGDGIEQRVIDRLTKWATSSKKELAFSSKVEV
jgi:copper chaperone CopZ